MKCPICGSVEFAAFRGREYARCRGCGGFERSRLLWLALERLPIHQLQLPFMHFAPEIGIAKGLVERLGSRYRAYDFQPEIYAKAGLEAKAFDLCTDTALVESGSVGSICHVHVLEHVRCNAGFVLARLNRLLAPGGFHIFGVPFYSPYFSEDLSPAISVEERLQRFGHEDHVRSFGFRDFEVMFGPAFDGMERVDLGQMIGPEELAQFNIPPRALASYNAHSVFIYRKC